VTMAMRSSIQTRSKFSSPPTATQSAAAHVAAGKSRRIAPGASSPRPAASTAGARPEPKLLFQRFFKSVGPRNYSAQLKELANGNRVLILTEEKNDPNSPPLRPLRLYVFGEDFSAFFRMLHEMAVFIRSNPLSPEIRRKRQDYWRRKARAARNDSR
jgi:hypothetical protein